MIRCALFVILSALATNLFAQTAFDALRFSSFDVTATARNMGVGGALSGLGADFSTLSTNPAGLGAYRFSEFLVTPALASPKSDAILLNDLSDFGTENSFSRLQLGSLGMVIVGKPSQSRWSTFSFAIGVNQIGNFAQEIKYEGSSVGSISDRFLEQVDGDFFNPFESELAIDTDLVADFDGDGIFETDYIFFQDTPLEREQTISRTGAISEFVFAFGGNYNEKLLIGLSVGVPFFEYTERKEYREQDSRNEVDFYEYLEFDEELSTSGFGVNAKLGAMWMVSKKFRLGAAVHTPTAFALEDTFSNVLRYAFTDTELRINTAESPLGTFEYNLRTPWRFIGNAGWVIGRNGFITSEVEMVNYGGARFNLTRNSDDPGDAEYEVEVNQQISDRFRNTLTFRVGGELVLNVLRLRAGLGIGVSPNDIQDEVSRLISAGIGYRKGRFFVDAAYRISVIEEDYVPYLTFFDEEQQLRFFPEQNVSIETSDRRLLLTMGIKF